MGRNRTHGSTHRKVTIRMDYSRSYDPAKIARPGRAIPPPKKRGLHVLRVPSEGELVVRVVCREMYTVETHWNKKERRTEFCTLPSGNCPFNHEENPPSWDGYLTVQTPGLNGKTALVHITPHCVRSCPKLLTEGLDLRNARLTLHRQGKGARRPIVADLATEHYMAYGVPRDHPTGDYVLEHFSQPNNAMRRLRKERDDG